MVHTQVDIRVLDLFRTWGLMQGVQELLNTRMGLYDYYMDVSENSGKIEES